MVQIAVTDGILPPTMRFAKWAPPAKKKGSHDLTTF